MRCSIAESGEWIQKDAMQKANASYTAKEKIKLEWKKKKIRLNEKHWMQKNILTQYYSTIAELVCGMRFFHILSIFLLDFFSFFNEKISLSHWVLLSSFFFTSFSLGLSEHVSRLLSFTCIFLRHWRSRKILQQNVSQKRKQKIISKWIRSRFPTEF